VAVAMLIGLAFAWMIGPRNLIGMALYDQRREGDLAVGDLAPDIELVGLDGTSQAHLLSAQKPGRPLVVVFGSFT
jgi:hypothetical protein